MNRGSKTEIDTVGVTAKTIKIEGAAATLSPEAGRAACLATTDDDKPFAVTVTAGTGADVVNCVADEHNPITIAMDSFPAPYYSGSKGRLFSVADPTPRGRPIASTGLGRSC